ncbi:MAG: RloB family protein, partial [Paramuribaculum sp.]|nr:RloB family protein [Paramuribaculum sp.]
LRELDLTADDDYEIFYIYDSDVRAIVDKLKTLPGAMILTNPCIELWFLLHARVHNRELDSGATVKMLMSAHQCWRNYSKGFLTKEQIDHLAAGRALAIERARMLSWPDNPSSNFHVFIAALEKEKKA